MENEKQNEIDVAEFDALSALNFILFNKKNMQPEHIEIIQKALKMLRTYND